MDGKKPLDGKRSETLPREFLKPRGAKDMEQGAEGYFPLEAIRIDVPRKGWVDPLAEPISKGPFKAGEVIYFYRTQTGFLIGLEESVKADLGTGGIWESKPKPDPKPFSSRYKRAERLLGFFYESRGGSG